MGQRTIDTVLRLQNESEYRSGLKNCANEMKVLKSELALVTSEFRTNANSTEALTAKGEVLTKMYESQQKKVALLRGALENAQKSRDEEEETVSSLREQYEQAKNSLAAFGDQVDKNSEEYKKAKAEVDNLRDSIIQHQAKMDSSTASVTKYSTQLNRAQIDLNQLEDQQAENNRLLDEAKASADGCAASMDKYGDSVKEAAEGTGKSVSAVEALSTAIVASGVQEKVEDVAAALMDASHAAQDFELSVAKVSTIADDSVMSTDEMRTGIMELSTDLRRDADEVAGAVYDALSAGVDTANVLEFTSQAAQLAEAGFTDVGTSVDVLTSILNAYKLESSQTEAVASKLVKTQDLGKTTVDDLGKVIGRVAPSASAYGVNLDNIATAYARITETGLNAEQTTTLVSAMLDELADSGSDVASILYDRTGASFTQLMESGKSLGDVLEILGESVGYDSTEFANLWSSATASKAAVALFDGSADAFNDTLNQMANASGSVAKNYEKMTETSDYASRRVTTASKNLSIAIGTQLNPVLDKLRNAGAGILEKAAEVVASSPALVAVITGIITALGSLAAGISALMIVKSVTRAMKAFNITLASNPVALVTAGVVGLVSALAVFASSAKSSSKEVAALTVAARDLNDTVEAGEQAYEDAVISTAAAVETAGEYISRLKELEEQGLDTDVQQQEYAIILEKINSIMPGINAELDEQTKMVKGGTDALEEQVLAWEKNAMAQAVYTRYADDVAALADAEYELTKNQALLNMAKEEEEDILEKLNPLLEDEADRMILVSDAALKSAAIAGSSKHATEVQKLARQLWDSRKNQALLNEAITAGNTAIEENKQIVEAASEAMKQYGLDVEDTGDGVGDASGEMADAVTDAAEKAQEAYAEMFISARESLDRQIGLFDDLRGKSELSTADMIKNLQSQRQAFDDYADNIVLAMERGIDMGLVQQLSDGSKESMLLLAELVTGTGDQIDALNREFSGVNKSKDVLADLLVRMSQTSEDKWPEIIANWKDSGEALGAEAVEGIRKSVESGLKNSEDSMSDGLEQMVTETENIMPSLAAQMYKQGGEMGENVVRGAIKAIKLLTTEYMQALKRLSDAGAAAFKKADESNSPSKRYQRLASYEVQGLITQYKADTPKLQQATASLADSGYIASINARRAAIPSLTAAVTAAPAANNSEEKQLLTQILSAIKAGAKLYLNGDVLVGYTADSYNAALGESVMLAERGAGY